MQTADEKKKCVRDYKTQKETHARECLIFPEGELSNDFREEAALGLSLES